VADRVTKVCVGAERAGAKCDVFIELTADETSKHWQERDNLVKASHVVCEILMRVLGPLTFSITKDGETIG